MYGVVLSCPFWSSISFKNWYALWWTVHVAMHMSLWSKTEFFEKVVINVQNVTFVQTSRTPRPGSVRDVAQAFGIHSISIDSHLETTNTTGDPISAGIAINWNFELLRVWFGHLYLRHEEIWFSFRPLYPVPSIAAGVECQGTLIRSVNNFVVGCIWCNTCYTSFQVRYALSGSGRSWTQLKPAGL